MRPPAPAEHYIVADLGRRRRADPQRLEIEPAERLHQAEAGFEIEAERVALDRAAVAEMQPHRGGFGDQIADRQHQPVVDQDAIAGALGAERLGAESIRRNDRMQPDHTHQRAIEIVTVILGARLKGRGHFPFGRGGHQGISWRAGRWNLKVDRGSAGREDGMIYLAGPPAQLMWRADLLLAR
ncbi:hypothetical protein ABIF13_008802 [Bradyrhizobium elkanii]